MRADALGQVQGRGMHTEAGKRKRPINPSAMRMRAMISKPIAN